jgi:hypothetical protein
LKEASIGLDFRILGIEEKIHPHRMKLVQEPESFAERTLGQWATIGEALSGHCA